MLSNKFVWVDQGQAAFEAVHVENVAEAIHLSLSKGKDRNVYLITDDEVSTFREFFTAIFKRLQLPIPWLSLPTFILSFFAVVSESLWRWTQLKSAPILTRFDLSFVNMPRRYNIQKAKSELLYKPVITRDEGFAKLQPYKVEEPKK